MYIGIRIWRKNNWVSFVVIFLVLALHLAIVRYPIIFPDSARYLGAAVFLNTNPYSPTLVSYLIGPLVVLIGAWGFVVFQMAILTYVLVSTLRFFNKNSAIGIISIIISAAGLMAITVMMDIYSAIGLLALFLILNGERDIILHIILSLCFVAHYGNVFLFPICAVLYWLIFNRKNFASLALPIILFIIPLLTACLVNYGLEKDFRLLSKAKYSVLAARIMVDSPEITRGYMKKYSESKLTKHRQEYEEIISNRNKKGAEALLWDIYWGKGLFDKFGGNIKFNREAKKIVVYALKNHPGILLRDALYNTYKFLRRPDYVNALVRNKGPLIYNVQKFMPHQIKQAKKSLQYRNNLSAINFELFYKICYYISLSVITTFLILSICLSELRKVKYFSFVVFAIIVLLFNALVMQNSGIYGRYQVRTLLLPCLAICLIVGEPYFWRKGVKLMKKS